MTDRRSHMDRRVEEQQVDRRESQITDRRAPQEDHWSWIAASVIGIAIVFMLGNLVFGGSKEDIKHQMVENKQPQVETKSQVVVEPKVVNKKQNISKQVVEQKTEVIEPKVKDIAEVKDHQVVEDIASKIEKIVAPESIEPKVENTAEVKDHQVADDISSKIEALIQPK
jgi:hypothetical protein